MKLCKLKHVLHILYTNRTILVWFSHLTSHLKRRVTDLVMSVFFFWIAINLIRRMLFKSVKIGLASLTMDWQYKIYIGPHTVFEACTPGRAFWLEESIFEYDQLWRGGSSYWIHCLLLLRLVWMKYDSHVEVIRILHSSFLSSWGVSAEWRRGCNFDFVVASHISTIVTGFSARCAPKARALLEKLILLLWGVRLCCQSTWGAASFSGCFTFRMLL